MNRTDSIFHSLGVIEKRIQEKLTVESLAESIHLSKFHYQRLFREAVGESVMRYVTRRRLSLAAGELAGTDLSVLEIALKYGYDSHEGFTRSFRSHMGVTPTEYRKHHALVAPIKIQKERSAMTYSKAADEIIRELNGLIIQARETAAHTRARPDSEPASTFYTPFWEFIAAQAETMADELSAALSRVTALPQQPDGIFARFRIIKAIEDTVFRSHITAFQARLTACRAQPEDRAALEPLCARYEALAQSAQIKSGKIAAFFRELASLILRDMRETAQSLLDRAAAKGKAAYEAILADPSLPYGYIGDEVRYIAEGLAAVPLEQMTAALLEDLIFRLDIIDSAAGMDAIRAPFHRKIFGGISEFKDRLREAEEFFQGLSRDAIRPVEDGVRSSAKMYRDMAFQGNILLFYLRGEIQKLASRLTPEQKTSFGDICQRTGAAIKMALEARTEEDRQAVIKALGEVHRELTTEADKLGIYGDAVRFIGRNFLMGSSAE